MAKWSIRNLWSRHSERKTLNPEMRTMLTSLDGVYDPKAPAVADENERRQQLSELLGLIRLEGFEHHYPHQLSGGMRQRVELARALAGDSETLLMDEPFSSLDYLARIRMRQELARILHERPRTVVLVTHDIEEAAQLADRVIVLTERPAEIRCELTIRAPRPRGMTHPEVVQAIDRLLTELGIQSEGDGSGPGLSRTKSEE